MGTTGLAEYVGTQPTGRRRALARCNAERVIRRRYGDKVIPRFLAAVRVIEDRTHARECEDYARRCREAEVIPPG